MNKSRIRDRASQATQGLEQTWELLRTLIPQLPPAVVVVLNTSSRRRQLGDFTPSVWRYRHEQNVHEIGISPDLFHTPEEVLCTFLHEASHAVLFASDRHSPQHIAGCSPDGYYHRKEFRDTCRELGLECLFKNRRYGWCLTQWPADGVPERYHDILHLLKGTLPWGTGKQKIQRLQGDKPPASGHTKLLCQCAQPRAIYVSMSVKTAGGIVCRFCNGIFRTEDARHGGEAGTPVRGGPGEPLLGLAAVAHARTVVSVCLSARLSAACHRSG